MEFRGKEQRSQCYQARDAYFNCLDKQPAVNGQQQNKITLCQELYEKFEKVCGKKWTEHFTRKQEYLKFKAKLEKEGVEAVDQTKLKK